MEARTYTDALSGTHLEFALYGPARATVIGRDEALPECTSLFFPGCSFMNYAMALVDAVYDTLQQCGQADGISFVCCGKILSYEPDGVAIRAAFEEELRERLARTSIKRIICACPNCVKALRAALGNDERTASIEVAVLPRVLADAGYRLNPTSVNKLVTGDENRDAMLCPHDSCPDRETGEFADALRELLPEGMWRDPAHCRSRSLCCGSLPRAAGKFEAADKLACRNGEEASEVGADAIVAACMSCIFQLNMAQASVQAVHFLELLYSWRIDWSQAGLWMKLRFLFDETLGAEELEGDRSFVSVDGEGLIEGELEPTVADDALVAAEELEGIDLPLSDERAAKEASISNR